ncbi:hypothetical protein D3C87_1733690 [compost metagenome]
MASAVIADGGDDVAGLVLIPLGKALEDVALRIGDQMARITEDIREIGDADRLEIAGGEARTRDDHVDRAELEALVDVGFLAEL